MIFIKKRENIEFIYRKNRDFLNILSALHKSKFIQNTLYLKLCFFGVSLVWNTSPSYKQLLK